MQNRTTTELFPATCIDFKIQTTKLGIVATENGRAQTLNWEDVERVVVDSVDLEICCNGRTVLLGKELFGSRYQLNEVADYSHRIVMLKRSSIGCRKINESASISEKD